MEKKYLEQAILDGKSIRQIAEESDKGYSTVRYWLKKLGLKSNLKSSSGEKIEAPLCKCGESNPELFYGRSMTICIGCQNSDFVSNSQKKRSYARKKLGGKCQSCGFDKYQCSLDIHHTVPELKDPNFSSLGGWSFERIDRELETCMLLCKNCHTAHHCGLLDIDE